MLVVDETEHAVAEDEEAAAGDWRDAKLEVTRGGIGHEHRAGDFEQRGGA